MVTLLGHYVTNSAAVSIIPAPEVGYISTPGGEARFSCTPSSSASVEWLVVSGSLTHSADDLSNAETTDMRREVWILRLRHLTLSFNGTTIVCTATFSDGQTWIASTSLHLQGCG